METKEGPPLDSHGNPIAINRRYFYDVGGFCVIEGFEVLRDGVRYAKVRHVSFKDVSNYHGFVRSEELHPVTSIEIKFRRPGGSDSGADQQWRIMIFRGAKE